MQRRWKKMKHIALSVFLLFASISPTLAFATDSEGSVADQMAQSMLEFFREGRTGLDLANVHRDEKVVYGVFMSNFYIPFHTTLGDLVAEGDDSFAARISTKFFGSAGNQAEVLAIHKDMYDTITSAFGFEAKKYGLYAASPNDSTAVMDGNAFFEKMAGIGGDKIYGANGQTLVDFSDKATQAALQVLFGISPEFMLSDSKGLRKLTALYMDGWGNIWGAPGAVEVKDYILVLPAALNPAVFPKGSNGFKFPVSNVFTMGGVLKITQDFLSDKPFNTPYYNLLTYAPGSTYNTNNVINIFGIQSPMNYIGKTDNLIKNKVGSSPHSSVIKMLDGDTSSTMANDSSNIVVSTNLDAISNIDKLVEGQNSLTTEQRVVLVNYLAKTTVFKPNELADDMYYFSTPLSSANASGGEGSFDNIADLIPSQKLFAKEIEKGKAYKFYSNSYVSSPHNNFMLQMNGSGDPTQVLAAALKVTDTTSESFKALLSFYTTGTWGTTDVKTIKKAMELTQGANNNVYGLVVPSTHYTKIATKVFVGWLGIKALEPVGFALTPNDQYTLLMSIASNDASWWNSLNSYYPVTDSLPFGVTQSGGEIKAAKTELTSVEINALANYYHNFYSYRIFSMNSTFTKQLTGVSAGAGSYSTPWGDLVNKTAIMNEVNNYPGIYWGYMVQLLQITPTEDGTAFEKPKRYENPHIPHMEISSVIGGLDINGSLQSGGVVNSEDKTLEEMTKDITKKIYGLLSEGSNEYRDNLIKSTQDSWIVSTHRAITGSWKGNTFSVSAGGNDSYNSIVGFINTPSLTELPLTERVLGDYVYFYITFIVIIVVLLAMMVLLRTRTVREAFLVFFVMAFVLVLPQHLINSVVTISNTFSDKLFSERFNYWAITQHEQSIATSVSYSSEEFIISSAMQNATNVYSTDAGVRLKWMSPKKDDNFDKVFNRHTANQDLMSNLVLFRWLFNSYINQEEYVYDDPFAIYLYRPYQAIVTEAGQLYKSLSSTQPDPTSVLSSIASNQTLGIPSYRFGLFGNEPNVQFTEDQVELIQKVKAFPANDTTDALEAYRYWGLSSDAVTEAIFRSDYTASAGYTGSAQDTSYQAYSAMTESPFYYFYFTLKHRYANNGGEFKTALLNEEVFKVKKTRTLADNELRDFLDLEGLFTYVIPYLHQGNEYVYGWTNIYGKTIDGYDFTNGEVGEIDTEDAELQSALAEQYLSEETKKENLKNVWKLYTPWVDQMYTLDVYSKKVPIANKTVRVDDLLNPASYDAEGRPMVFSKADMYAKNYELHQLSDIEHRMQEVLEKTYKDLMYLTNYYDFSDEVLLSAAAMAATFNFNEAFSQTRLLGDNTELYPQGYELKNFNYDAFMRLILLNATGESIMSDKDLYVRVLQKTSIFTGIFLLLVDILGVIVIPAVKVIILVLLFFLSILVVFSSILHPPEKLLRVIMMTLGLPALYFLLATSSFALLISFFMGEGLTGYVGGRAPSLGISDPTLVLLIIAIVSLVYLYVLWKILRSLFVSIYRYSKTTFFSTVALATDTAAYATYKVRSSLNLDAELDKKQRKARSVQEESSGGSSRRTKKGKRDENGIENNNDAYTDNTKKSDGTFTMYTDDGKPDENELADKINDISLKTDKDGETNSDHSKERSDTKTDSSTTQPDTPPPSPTRTERNSSPIPPSKPKPVPTPKPTPPPPTRNSGKGK